MAEEIGKGSIFGLTRNWVPTHKFSQSTAEVVLPPELYQKCFVDGGYYTLSAKRLDGSKRGFTPPNIANLTLSGAIDLLGEVRERKKECETLEEIYKQFIDAEITRKKEADAEKKDQNSG